MKTYPFLFILSLCLYYLSSFSSCIFAAVVDDLPFDESDFKIKTTSEKEWEKLQNALVKETASDCHISEELMAVPLKDQTKTLDQGDYGTCFACVALKLLEQFVYKQGLLDPNAEFDLGTIVTYGNAKGKFQDGGFIDTALYNIRKRGSLPVKMKSEMDLYKQICLNQNREGRYGITSLLRCIQDKSNHECTPSALPIDHYPLPLQKLYYSLMPFETPLAPNRSLSLLLETPKNELNTLTLPAFDIVTIHFQAEDDYSKRVTLLQEQFKKGAFVGIDLPAHSILATGSRKVCCGPKKDQCHMEIHTRNSWGEEGEVPLLNTGWVKADELLSNTKNIVYLEECLALECSPSIKGTHNPPLGMINANEIEWMRTFLKDQKAEAIPTTLQLVAAVGSKEMLEALLQDEAQRRQQTIPEVLQSVESFKILEIALFHGRSSMIDRLIQHGANLNERDQAGDSLLHRFATIEDLDSKELSKDTDKRQTLAKLIFDQSNKSTGIEFNDEGLTPLHLASKYGNTDTMQALLDLPIDETRQDKECAVRLSPSLQGQLGNSLLVSYPFDGHFHVLPPALCRSLAKVASDAIVPLKNNSILIRDAYHGRNALHFAAISGKQDAVNLLLDYSFPVNSRDARELTPLHFAVQNRNLSVAKSLLSHRADVNAVDRRGLTPLYLAVKNKDVEMIEVLINRGANPKLNVSPNETIKDVAVKLYHLDPSLFEKKKLYYGPR
ncbi:MAG: ankyrin repeat domain-containing protein [Oligoflexia bacterium]|nr:ankyrin repeat domain-containing protein [Oligoflexia bacterium]